MGNLEMHHFTRPETRVIRHLQQCPVAQGLGGSEQLADIMATEDDGELAGFLRQRNRKVHRRAAQARAVEKAHTMPEVRTSRKGLSRWGDPTDQKLPRQRLRPISII